MSPRTTRLTLPPLPPSGEARAEALHQLAIEIVAELGAATALVLAASIDEVAAEMSPPKPPWLRHEPDDAAER